MSQARVFDTTGAKGRGESCGADSIHRFVAWVCAWTQRYDLYFFSAALALLSFSAPGREGPGSAGGVDLIALAKFGIRIAAVGYFGFLFVWSCSRAANLAASSGLPLESPKVLTTSATVDATSATVDTSSQPFRPTRILPMFVPWGVFAAWSLVSVAWSALPAVSLGQWLGLVALLAYSHTLAVRQSANDSTNPIDWVRMVRWLHAVLFVYCATVMAVHLVSPETSGLDRALWIAGSNGLVHPTAAGATSSLGVLLGVFLIARKLTRHRLVLIAMVIVELSLLYSSKSRAALLMTAICLFVYSVFLTSARVRGVGLLTIGAMMLAVATIDPGFEWLGAGADEVANYLSRGQTADELKNASGRSEMWAAIWEQIQSSPFRGHGYFVTSNNGLLDVWQGPSNQDAHNVMLQVWVTTGLIGVLPFVWAMVRMVRGVIGESNRDIFWLMVLLGIWYAGWGQGCVTFLGPIRPESVVFFTALGILASRTNEIGRDGISVAQRGSIA